MSAERLDLHTLRLSRRFPVPPEVAFQAWTEPEVLRKWWGPARFSVPTVDIDLRPGGRFRIVMQPPDRSAHVLSGTYVEVVAPSRLVYTWTWQGTPEDDGYESLVTVAFDAVAGGTEVTLVQERLPGKRALDEHREGWSSTLDRLRDLLEGTAA